METNEKLDYSIEKNTLSCLNDEYSGARCQVYNNSLLEVTYTLVATKRGVGLTSIEGNQIWGTTYDNFIGIEIQEHSIDKHFRVIIYFTNFARSFFRGEIVSRRQIEKQTMFTKNPESALSLRATALNYLLYFSNELQEIPQGTAYRRRALVFVNPVGGKGLALKIYEKVSRILEASGFVLRMIKTKRRFYARDYVKNLAASDFDFYDLFISIGGDGIPHELINGYFSRPDYHERALTLGILPGGSGCALNYTILKRRHLDHTLDNSIYLLSRKKTGQMNVLAHYLDTEEAPVYGFLNYLWGYFADVDFGSEKLRFLGHLRFDVYGFYKAFFKKHREATIYWTDKETDILPHIDDEPPKDWKRFSGSSTALLFLNLPYISKDYLSAPGIEMDDGHNLMTLCPSTMGFWQFGDFLLSHSDGSFLRKESKLGIMNSYMKAYRIEIRESGSPYEQGYISIDGEKYQGTILQGKVLDKSVNLLL